MQYRCPWCRVWAGVQLLFWLGGLTLVRRHARRRVPGCAGSLGAPPETPGARSRESPAGSAGHERAISFFRPLKTCGAPRLRDLQRFVRTLQPSDEVIFGLEGAETPLARSLLRLAGRDARVKVIRCCTGNGIPNRKMAKLMQMTAHARHDRWVLFDSEAVPTAALLQEIRARLDEATAVTAAYRFSGLRTLPQFADAMATLTFLFVGDAWSRFAGRPTAVHGACLAITRQMWERLGGWERFGHSLADDFQVGRALRAGGVCLHRCREPVLLRADPLGWRHFWDHQLRIAATYRVSEPAGFAGAGLVFALPLLFSACLTRRRTGWLGAVAVCLMRAAVQMEANRCLGMKIPPGTTLFLTPVLLITEFAAWALTWFSSRVRWGNQEFEIGRGGWIREIDAFPARPCLQRKASPVWRGIFGRGRRLREGVYSTSTGIPVLTKP